MAILSVNQVGETGFEDDKGFGYVRKFHVQVSSTSEERKDVIRASGVPLLHARHPDDPTTKVSRKDADLVGDSRLLWEVDVEYRRREPSDLPDVDAGTRPWDQPARISFGRGPSYVREATRAYVEADKRNAPSKAITNSAGQRFDPVGQEESGVLIRIARNEKLSNFGPETISRFKNTINKTQIVIAGYSIPPRYARMKDITGERIIVPDIEGAFSIGGDDYYWAAVYEIEVDPRGYDKHFWDVGYYENSDGSPKKILDLDGDLVLEPVPLNGSGARQSLAVAPKFRVFQTYFADFWNNLDLPRAEDSDR